MDHLQSLLNSVSDFIRKIISIFVDIFHKFTEGMGNKSEFRKATDKVNKEFFSHQQEILRYCNDAANKLKNIIQELTIARVNREFDPIGLQEIERSMKMLSDQINGIKNKNRKIQDNLNNCKLEFQERLDILSSQDVPSFQDLPSSEELFDKYGKAIIAAATTTVGTFMGLTQSATIAEITGFAIKYGTTGTIGAGALTGTSILVGAVFAYGVLFVLEKYSTYAKTNELRHLGEHVGELFGAAEKLEEMFDKAVLALGNYLDANKKMIRLSTNTDPVRVGILTRDLIYDTKELQKMFLKIQDLASKKISERRYGGEFP